MSNTSETPLPHPIPATSEDIGPLVGKVFGGYEITSYIGEGPTGSVYRAEDLMGSRMAVKVMHRELSQKDAAEKLWADLQKLNALGSPHFVRVYEAGFDDEGQFFYTMDELVGSDLDGGLEESGALAPQKAFEIVRQVCIALEASHAAGVVHGGLKPRNIFLQPCETGLVVKVLDPGAARLAGGVDKGVIVGNPFYMAPEQFGGQASAHTDVYALGVIMYELFSGTLPFAGPSHGQVMMRHLAEVPQPPPGVDEELAKIILRSLVKTPAGRYGSVAQLRLALERWAQSAPSLLSDAAAFHVVARAEEARALKQAALSSPDATAPMPKMDLAELARGTHPDVRERVVPPPKIHVSSNKGEKGMHKNGADHSNSSESVEASLEDFINQANASFPATTSDGWDLHTGDVELVDEAESELESKEHIKAPLAIKGKATEKLHPVNPAQVAKPVTREQPAQRPTVKGFPAAAQPVTVDPVAAAPAVVVEPQREHTPSAPQRRSGERTAVVQPASVASVPWTANPLVIIGGLLAAFIIGAGLVFLMVRTMMPSAQPVVVQAPAVVAPVQQPQQPVVTPLPAAAQPVAVQPVAQPVVTPLPTAAQPVAAQPVAAQPVAAQPVEAQPAAVEPPAPRTHKAASPKSHKAAAPAAAKPAKAKAAASDDEEDKPAAKPAKPAKPREGAASKGSGGDWVDPFAQ